MGFGLVHAVSGTVDTLPPATRQLRLARVVAHSLLNYAVTADDDDDDDDNNNKINK